MAYIVSLNDPRAIHCIVLTGDGFLIGRHPDCNLVLDMSSVSRQHARITRDAVDYFIQDLGSRNKTYVNGTVLDSAAAPTRLRDGDKISFCDLEYIFRTADAPEPQRGILFVDEYNDDSIQPTMAGDLRLTASPEARLSALRELTRSLMNALASDEVLPRVLQSLFKIFLQAHRALIALRGHDGTLTTRCTQTQQQELPGTARIKLDIADRVMATREGVLAADVALDEAIPEVASMEELSISSIMCAPLINIQGQSFGVLQLETDSPIRRFQQEDLEILVMVATQVGIALDSAQRHETTLQKHAVDRDLELAREVQQGFLPQERPRVKGYEFYDFYRSATQVGGDYFDYLTLPDGRIGVILADAIGRGMTAALLMARFSAEAHYCVTAESDPGKSLRLLNDRICKLHIDRFITAVLLIVDPFRHEVTLANAGHFCPFLRSARGVLSDIGTGQEGMPLGILDDAAYATTTVPLAPGDMILIFTDGLSEALNETHEYYGIARLREEITTCQGRPRELGAALIEDVSVFMGQAAQSDDMCLVVIGRTNHEETPADPSNQEDERDEIQDVAMPDASPESPVSVRVHRTCAGLRSLLKDRKSLRFRGPLLDEFQQALLHGDPQAIKPLSAGFHSLVVFDATQGLDAKGQFQPLKFQEHILNQLEKAFGHPAAAQKFHPAKIAQYLKRKERSLFCFLNVQYFTPDTFRSLRGLGFIQRGHSAIYCGEHEYLNDRTFRLPDAAP